MHNAFRNVEKLPTKYNCNTNPCITTMILEDYLTQLDMKVDAKNRKILPSLISVLLTLRTHFSETQGLCFFQLTVPTSYSF